MSVLNPEVLGRVGNDPIFALNAEARARAEGGESILNATLGALTRDDGSLAVMGSAAVAFEEVPPHLAAGYAPIAGTPGFLDAVVSDLFGNGPLVEQAVAVATPGSTGAIYQAVGNFLERGQAALAPSLYWGPYRVICEHQGRGVDTFEMFTPSLRMDVDALAAGLDRQLRGQGRALVLLNFPCNNPTGYSLDAGEWEAVAAAIAEAGRSGPVAMVLDYAYARFGGVDGAAWVDVAPLIVGSATLLVGWTASKSYTQYGARVGALVALHRDEQERGRIAAAVGYTCRATWSNCNHRGMIATQRLLSDPAAAATADAERGELVSLLGERVDAFNRAARAAGLRFPRHDGGFFVSVLTPDSERTAAAMRKLGVYVVPVRGAVRVALCSTPAREAGRLVDALRAGVAAARP
jgi:aromatic-amino-acid transaminase